MGTAKTNANTKEANLFIMLPPHKNKFIENNKNMLYTIINPV